jgi:hypothetical protein
MKLSSHQGEYRRVVKHLSALRQPHTFTDARKASRVSAQISELRRVKAVLERGYSGGAETLAPAPLRWKPPIIGDIPFTRHGAPTNPSVFNRVKTLFSRMFSRRSK